MKNYERRFMEKQLQHWGILGMHWGIRRFQNPDGSLTPEGRERYGVGLIQTPKNVGNRMSDDELKQMTDRYRKETNFYKARNEYLESEIRYKQLMTPPKKESKFLQRVFVEPIEKALGKNVEAGLLLAGASLVSNSESKFAEQYVSYIFNSGGKNKNKDNKQQQFFNKPSKGNAHGERGQRWEDRRQDNDDDDEDEDDD